MAAQTESLIRERCSSLLNVVQEVGYNQLRTCDTLSKEGLMAVVEQSLLRLKALVSLFTGNDALSCATGTAILAGAQMRSFDLLVEAVAAVPSNDPWTGLPPC
jgi:hypothetical protein